jgi:hypothetical protein
VRVAPALQLFQAAEVSCRRRCDASTAGSLLALLVILCWRRAAHRYEIITFRGCCELSSRKVFFVASSSSVG